MEDNSQSMGQYIEEDWREWKIIQCDKIKENGRKFKNNGREYTKKGTGYWTKCTNYRTRTRTE